MGYDLHITRASDWSDNKDNWITSEEWLSLINCDHELVLNKVNGPFFADWNGASKYETPWFDWSEGNIFTKNPDRAIVGKMLQIANELNATVQGDDGETYEDINDIPELPQPNELENSSSSQLPLYLRRENLWSIITVATLAIVILAVNLLDLW